MTRYQLKLYVTGRTALSTRVIENLRDIGKTELHGQYDLEVIDVLEHPELAQNEKILATPTLVRELPPPIRKIIGDLSDRTKILRGLGLDSSD